MTDPSSRQLSAPGPSADQPLRFWRGNLPCCTDDRSGCENHNPSRHPVFFDPTLPTHVKTGTSAWLKTLKETAARAQTTLLPGSSASSSATQTEARQQQPVPEIWCSIPRTLETTHQLLPQIHPNVHYALFFYHVHTIMAAVRNGQDPAPYLAALTCRGKSGKWPQIEWRITPKIAALQGSRAKTFLIEHLYAFTLPLKHATGYAFYAKSRTPLLASGYRHFAPCRHFALSVRQVREERRRAQYFAAVDVATRNVLGQEFQDTWRSDVAREPANMCCGMCFTDSALRFQVLGDVILVRFSAHRDLGEGAAAEDPKWVAGVQAQLQRGHRDFGTIRRCFEG